MNQKFQEEKRIDLHVHTTASDGSLAPGELVQEAFELGLAAVGITDHDTVGGIDEALAASENYDIEVVPGVEVSSQTGDLTIHLLGYYINHHDNSLKDMLSWMITARNERNPRLIKKLNDLGIPISLEMVHELAGNTVVGRPHFAKALVSLGATQSQDEAFNKFLGSSGGLAYIPKARMPSEKAINCIRQSGGIPVLAHPMTIEKKNVDIYQTVRSLKEQGLEGIEAYYSQHSSNQTERYLELAKRYNLIVTGGSDFHGSAKPDIKLGSGKGSLDVPHSVLSALKDVQRKLS